MLVGLGRQAGAAIEFASFDLLSQGVDPVEREAERLSHVANRAAGAIGDYHRGHAGPLASVLLVQVLQHLFTSLMLEVDAKPFFRTSQTCCISPIWSCDRILGEGGGHRVDRHGQPARRLAPGLGRRRVDPFAPAAAPTS